MKIIKSFLSILLCLSLLFLNSCSNDTTDSSSKDDKHQGTLQNNTVEIKDQDYGFQLDAPQKGEEIVVLETSLGTIKIRLFPDYVPKTVENFVGLVKEGYYDGITFHRVINDFMIQGGDPTGTGSGGESLWGEDFEDEFCDKLNNIRGSLAMANAGVNTNSSQFFINQKSNAGFNREDYDYDQMYKMYEEYYQSYAAAYSDFKAQVPTVEDFIELNGGINPNSKYVPDEIWELYEQYGGNISLDGAWRDSGGHTVFGQVFEGMDVVDKIAAVDTDDNDKPLEDVVIKKATVEKY